MGFRLACEASCSDNQIAQTTRPLFIFSKDMFIRTLCVSKNLNWVRLRKHFLVVALE